MSEEKFSVKLDQAKGALKEAAGKLLDDKELEVKGSVEKVLAKGEELVDDAKDAVKGAVDAFKEKFDDKE